MPSRTRPDNGETIAAMNGMLQLLGWQEQLICSVLDRLQSHSDGGKQRKSRSRKVTKRGKSDKK